MPPPSDTLADSIAHQREALKTLLREPLAQTAQACSLVWGDRQRLNAALTQAWAQFPIGKYLYAMNTQATQISDTISRDGTVANDLGRDRADRPYLNERVP
ncbi:MAG: hypothetical protein Q7T90_01030, partial [Thiobacillus sp.]|nr:hypothetical protein [Thiobacillus sp.]